MRSTWGPLLFAFCLSSGTAAQLGCSDCSVSGQDPIRYDGGQTNKSRTLYQSSLAGEAYLHFPQGRVYQFHHGLGRAPADVNIFVSFKEQLEKGADPNDKTEPNNVGLAAGNQAVIEVWDEEMIQIRNDTCENNFYVRVVALANPDEPVSGGAGGKPN